jgi:hypothetical protein
MAGTVAWRLALLQNVVMEFELDIPFIMQFNAYSTERNGGNSMVELLDNILPDMRPSGIQD